MNIFINKTIANTLMSLWAYEFSLIQNENSKSNFLRIIHDVDNYYNMPGRYYHNASHVLDMIEAYEAYFRDDMSKEEDKIIMTAIIFHDVIYFPWSSKNEEVSAEYAREFLNTFLDNSWNSLKLVVQNCILATKHNNTDLLKEAQILCDLDLNKFIWMTSRLERLRLVDNLRFENYLVDDKIFILGRIEFIKDMLSKEHIYYTDEFQKREKYARENLECQLKELTNILNVI